MDGRNKRATYLQNLYERNDIYYDFFFSYSYISFFCRIMSKILSTLTYMLLLTINTPFIFITGFSIGTFYAHSEEVDTALLRLDLSKQNRTKLWEHIKLNCSNLLIEYPEFDTFPRVELCYDYHLAMNLGKLMIVFSTFYHICLLYRLHGAHRLSTVIMGILSAFFFYVKFINDQWMLILVESILISVGFSIIFGHYAISSYNNNLKKQ